MAAVVIEDNSNKCKCEKCDVGLQYEKKDVYIKYGQSYVVCGSCLRYTRTNKPIK